MRTFLPLPFLAVIAIAPGHSQAPSPPASTPFQQVVLAEVRRHPALEIQDLYKFVFQAAMGNEHLMADSSMVYQYLRMELNSIRPDTAEPLMELLTPDSSLVRLNLRSFKSRRGNAQFLLHAMLATSLEIHPSSAKLRLWWADVEELARNRMIPFIPDRLHSFFLEMSSRGFPAVHHSQQYTGRYQPSYRVVAPQHLRFLFGLQAGTGTDRMRNGGK